MSDYTRGNTIALTDTDHITWDTTLALPTIDGKDHPGLAGVFSAYVDGKLVVAGGANFPDCLPSEGGQKRWWGMCMYTTALSGKYMKICFLLQLHTDAVFNLSTGCSVSADATVRNVWMMFTSFV